MESVYNIIISSEEIPDNYKYYWSYQYKLGVESIVPYIKRYGAFQENDSIMEIGSAEGGVLAAFVLENAKDALGTDIAENRLEMGSKIAKMSSLPIEFIKHNILEDDIPANWENKFNLILLRDVIEHLEDSYQAIKSIKKLLKPGGYLFVTFPPYHSPYGGHQHTVGTILAKLPFIHLLPNFLFHSLISGGSKPDIGEVKRLQNIKLTPKIFELDVEKAGYKIHKRDFYIIRPVFKMKFGLPAIKLTALSCLPFVKTIFSMEASYLLKKV